MKIGSKLIWAINAKFTTKKVGNKWIRTTKGTKGQIGYKTPKMKQFKITTKRRKRKWPEHANKVNIGKDTATQKDTVNTGKQWK